MVSLTHSLQASCSAAMPEAWRMLWPLHARDEGSALSYNCQAHNLRPLADGKMSSQTFQFAKRLGQNVFIHDILKVFGFPIALYTHVCGQLGTSDRLAETGKTELANVHALFKSKIFQSDI